MATTGYFLNQYFTTSLNVGGGIDDTQTTGIVIQAVSGLDITKPGIACISYSDPINTSTAEWVTYTSINGSNELQGVTRGAEGFGAKTHSNLATVAFPISESHINNLATALSIGGVATNIIETTKDEDNMASDSATALATQQSIKAYVDTDGGSLGGWTAVTDTWTYASASTFTIAGVDRTAVFTKGTRLKFTQTTVKYAVVVASSFSTNTTVTIAVNTDYTIANAAITAPYYSYQASPAGYPLFFNWTPTFSASGSMTTASANITHAMYSITGGLLTASVKWQLTTGGTASTYVYFTYPVIPSTTVGDYSTIGNCSTDTNAGVLGAIGYSRTNTKLYIRRYDSGNFALTASHYTTGVCNYHI